MSGGEKELSISEIDSIFCLAMTSEKALSVKRKEKIMIWNKQGCRRGGAGGKRHSCPLLRGARGAKVPFSRKAMITLTTFPRDAPRPPIFRLAFAQKCPYFPNQGFTAWISHVLFSRPSAFNAQTFQIFYVSINRSLFRSSF